MKIIKGIINVLTTLIIVIGGIFLILYACGIVPYVVLSGSMEPTIETGSICFINKHADIKKIKENDIIAFKHNNGTLVTHRAVEITDSGIQTHHAFGGTRCTFSRKGSYTDSGTALFIT